MSDPDLDLAEVRRGLRMATPPDPERLAAERARLAELAGEGPWRRMRGYLALAGPGYLQSAMTLGSGTAAYALFAGAMFGYQLLWVAPIAILLGVVVLSAVAHQTLSTGMRPFDAMRRYAGPVFAWGWALGALLASIVWHLPQYSIASACLVDLGDALGVTGLRPGWMGLVVLVWAVAVSSLYGTSTTLVRAYERVLKYMIWGVVLCFGAVVVRTGISDWGALLGGFVPGIPEARGDVDPAQIVISGLAAAVGINMIFLYPYSLLARGWGREHRGLARFDLFAGMLVPYVLATSLMVIATANTLYPSFAGKSLGVTEAASSLAAAIGPETGRVVFNVGVLGMVLSTITMHMLAAGFVCSEMFGWKVGSFRYRLGTLLPTPGVLGSVFWGDAAIYLAVPTTIFCGFLAPVAYVGFVRLQASERYLGADRPTGGRGIAWLGAMVLATLVLVAFLGWYAITKM